MEAMLVKGRSKDFHLWKAQLHFGWNVLLYGVGSKLEVRVRGLGCPGLAGNVEEVCLLETVETNRSQNHYSTAQHYRAWFRSA